MKKIAAIGIILSIMIGLCVPALAAQPTGLTWDGQTSTLEEIAKNTGYDLVDANGNYVPMYYYFAKELWNNGLFLGSNGSFDLDNPLTRAEGVIMTIRILGKENEAVATAPEVTFTDVPDWAKPYVAYAVQNGIAGGYSTAAFGARDPMTAAQFITMVLRAMGYKDGDDFTWDKSYDKALDIGLIGEPCHVQYSRSNLFLRDNAAMISYSAIFFAPTKAGGSLADSIVMPGKPSGAVPYATAADKAQGGANTEDKPQTERPPEVEPVVIVGFDYEKFPVPDYESVDTVNERKIVNEADDRLYLAYSGSQYKDTEYIALLRASGFSRTGTVNFEPQTVTGVTGGIPWVGTKAWVCDWYVKGNLQVVFGRVGDAFIVRIYEGAIDTFSANGLRTFYRIITSTN